MQRAAERALESQLRAIEAGRVRHVHAHRRYEQYIAQRRAERRGRRPATRRTSRARSSRWIRAPARCARSSAAATSTTRSSIARRRRCASPARRSSRSSTPTAVQNGRPPSYIVDDSPHRCRRSAAADVDAAELRREVRGPDADAPRALPVAQHRRRSSSAWSSASRASSTWRASFGITTPHPALSVDLHRRGRRLSDRDGRRVLGVRQRSARARTPNAILRVENAKGDVLWEPQPVRVAGAVARRGVADGEHDEGRRAARHRGGHRWARRLPHARRRKDRHDQRRHRRLVHRLHRRPRRRRLDGLRQAAEDQGATRRAACSPRRRGPRS